MNLFSMVGCKNWDDESHKIKLIISHLNYIACSFVKLGSKYGIRGWLGCVSKVAILYYFGI